MGAYKQMQIELQEERERVLFHQNMIKIMREEMEDMERDKNKFRSQAIMRGNRIEMLELEIAMLKAQLEQSYE